MVAVWSMPKAALRAPFDEDFEGYEDPAEIETVLEAGRPYLPFLGASGEMILSGTIAEQIDNGKFTWSGLIESDFEALLAAVGGDR